MTDPATGKPRALTRLTEALAPIRPSMRRQPWRVRRARAHAFLDGVLAMLRPGDIVIDCGANFGDVSEPLAATGATVIAFEPDPFAFAKLSERLSRLSNVTLYEQAVSTEDARLPLRRGRKFEEDPRSESIKSTLLSGARGVDDEDYVEVDAINFVTFLRETIDKHGEITFLKMDIEGAELSLLRAMDEAGVLKDIRCVVVETHERIFKHLRKEFRALREDFAQKYSPRKMNLDWI